uniref:Uncharacterized protein n=1 Tax=Arundo donax TaxID=35708 RepID=A0A0A9A985_ARUDO
MYNNFCVSFGSVWLYPLAGSLLKTLSNYAIMIASEIEN